METINHETYVSLEVAKLLKEAGFDYKVKLYYEHDGKLRGKTSGSFINFNSPIIWQNNGNTDTQLYSAPTLEVTQRWLRDAKGVVVYVCPSYEPARFVAPNVVADDEKWLMKWQVSATHRDIESDIIDLGDVEEKCFDIYEEALEAGIKKALEIILEKGE